MSWQPYMHNDADYPRYFDVLCAAVVTLGQLAFVGLSLNLFLQDGGTLFAAIVASFFLLIAGTIPAVVFGGLISFPFWWVFKRYYRLDRRLAGGIGAFTGFILSVFYIYFVPVDYSGTPIGLTQASLLYMLFTTALCAIAGWNGYHVAWNGRRRKTAYKAKGKT